MIKSVSQPISKNTQIALNTFGEIIKAARLALNMSQEDLSKRLNISRQTVHQIEKGNPKVSIGTVFEAATLLGVPLLGDDMQQLKIQAATIANICALLPQRSGKNKELDDEF